MSKAATQTKFSAAMRAWKGNRSEVKAAADIQVAPNTLGAWIDGASLPPSTRLPAIAAALGMPLDNLAAMVARERSRRLRRHRAAASVVSGHAGLSSCRKSGSQAARRPGQDKP